MTFLKNHKYKSPGSSLVAHREGPVPMGAKFPVFRFGHQFYKENWKEQGHADTKSDARQWGLAYVSGIGFSILIGFISITYKCKVPDVHRAYRDDVPPNDPNRNSMRAEEHEARFHGTQAGCGAEHNLTFLSLVLPPLECSDCKHAPFLWCWGPSLGLCTCKARVPPGEAQPRPFV